MPSDTVQLSAMVPPILIDLHQTAIRQRPPIPYAGVAIGDATDSSLLSSLRPDRTGAGDLFTDAMQPHLGASFDATI